MPAPLELPVSVLRSVLGAAATVGRCTVIGLDVEGRIVGLFPDGQLLGYSAEELRGWYLAEALGGNLVAGFTFVRGKGGERTAISLSLLSLPTEVAGLDPAVRRLAVVAERPEAGMLLDAEELQSAGAGKLAAIQEELELAEGLQRSILPAEFPSDLPIAFAHKYVPDAQIGGDFYSCERLDRSHLGLVIADVSGHGTAAAFVTAMFSVAFANYASASPAATMSALNHDFCASIHTDHYITAFYAVIDTDAMEMSYCSAGHPKQLLCRASGECDELTSEGFFIGTFPSTVYREERTTLASGDRLVLCTDGILEVEGRDGQQFGRHNLRRIVEAGRELDLLSQSVIYEVVVDFMAAATASDDLTLFIAEILDAKPGR